MLNKELDNFVHMKVSGKQEVALGLRKSFAGIQKSTLRQWSKSGQKTGDLGSEEKVQAAKSDLGAKVEIHQARINYVFAVSQNWYGMVIYSGLIFILHMLLIFFIDMSLNILSFFIKFFIALFANFGSGGMSDIHLKSVQHRVNQM
jgi:hypothetical protein